MLSEVELNDLDRSICEAEKGRFTVLLHPSAARELLALARLSENIPQVLLDELISLKAEGKPKSYQRAVHDAVEAVRGWRGVTCYPT